MSRGTMPRTLAALGAIGTLGCASVPADAGFEDVQELVTERSGFDLRWNRGTPEDAQAVERVRALLAREMTPDDAVQVALLNNAGLQATYEELGVAQADLVEAGLLKNPTFDLEIRFPGDPRPPLEAHLIQDFLDLFLIPLRKQVAGARFEEAKLRVANEVLGVAAKVRTTCYDLQAAQQLAELRRSVVEAMDASADAAERIHAAGNLTDLDLANEQATAAEARLELAEAESHVLQQREHLNVLMGVWGRDTTWTMPGRLPPLPAQELPPVGLETLAITNSLALQAARRDIEATAQSLGLARATALVPEIEVGIHTEREPDGTNSFGPSIGFPLPIFNQGQPMTARARSLLRQVQQRYVEQAVTLRAEVRELRERMLSARRAADYHSAIVIPLRTRVREQTQLEYNAMLAGVFQLLQAKRAEIDAGRGWIESLHEYWVARAELEHAVGGRLPDDASPPAPAAPTGPQPQQPREEPHEHHHHGATP